MSLLMQSTPKLRLPRNCLKTTTRLIHRTAFATGLRQHDCRGGATAAVVLVPVRCFSDRLMGYSPMAPTGPVNVPSNDTNNSSNISHIPTAQDVTTSGGVWAPTSAKRDKIAELKTALTEAFKDKPKPLFGATLDDLATPVQKLDLWLVDGLQAIATIVDTSTTTTTTDNETDDHRNDATWKQVHKWMNDMYKEKDDLLTQHQFEDYLRRFQREMERHLAMQSTEVPTLLQNVRDYVDVSAQVEQLESPPPSSSSSLSTPPQFDTAVKRYRLLLAQAASQVLLDSWKSLTTVSSHDIDRAAVDGVALENQATHVPLLKVEALLTSYLRGNAVTRVDAWWNLVDRDDDGLLLEEEMTAVCDLAIRPVGQALQKLLTEALQAHPVRLFPNADDESLPVPNGWRQRRQEIRVQRQLQKMFTKTIKSHFQDEVEMAHRLRCIYTWANKAHQDNAIKSVLVDEIAWTGRKRYVELPPKISLEEFRQVQQEHFTHLDRVAAEYLKSFREDLWIVQGNVRQRSELLRDCALFMATVCGIDYVIISL